MNFANVLVLSLLAIMGGFSYKESRALAEKDLWVSHSREVLDLCEALRVHFTESGTARRAYVTDRDATQIPAFESASKATLAQIPLLRQKVADNPSQEARLGELEIAVRARLRLFEESVQSHQRNVHDEKNQETISEEGLNLTFHAVDEIRIFEDVERGLLQQRVAEAEAASRRASRINEFLGLSVFLLLIIAAWIVSRELTRRNAAEEAVGKERELLESILNSCMDIVEVADETGRIILRNPAAKRLCHDLKGEVSVEKFPKHLGFHREDGVTLLEAHDLPLARAVRGESVDEMEVYMQCPDAGEGRYFLAAGGPLVDNRGDRRGGVIFLRDITQRRHDKERLSAALLESERITRERSELTKLTDLFQSCHDVREACEVVKALSGTIFESRPGMLCLTNSSRNLVEGCASWGDCSSTKDVFEPSDCWGLRQGKPYVGTAGATLLRCPHIVDIRAGYLCMPLVAQGETYGVLYIEDQPAQPGSSTDAFQKQSQQFLSLATAVAERISLAVANLKLREVLRDQSIQDPLTGLFNRRYLEQSLDREVHRAARAGRSISLAMLDIDHFKHFNDTFGHQAGDLLLREVAAVFKARVRAGDLACRFGGEEFALVLAETDTNGAHTCVEKIREAVKHLALQFRGQSLGAVTLSAGIAAFPEQSENSEGLIHMADVALYRAKKEGRDRVVVSDVREVVPKLEKTL
jgi:diguanylate cyclase (GGDEF)-like protein/PAS domain S-box-containing protein